MSNKKITTSIDSAAGIQRVRCRVFFDFDNTITVSDVLDDAIKRFAVDKSWIELEEAWGAGKIGSRECLSGQLRSVRVSKNEFFQYLTTVKIDPFFKKILEFLQTKAIKPVILSDNFLFMVRRILKKQGITGIKIYSNRGSFSGNRFKLSFPYLNKKCLRCAHCKRNSLLDNSKKSDFKIYVGDGLSDLCAAQEADLVFAKDSLLAHFKKTKRPCVAFKTLRDVYNYLREDIL